jgi:hypothetical protein
VGTYAVWLEAQPPLDPELLRFTPPVRTRTPLATNHRATDRISHPMCRPWPWLPPSVAETARVCVCALVVGLVVPPRSAAQYDDELGGAEPLWRPQCSLLRYLRLAVLHAGGFPGCVGIDAFEPLRTALTADLLPF